LTNLGYSQEYRTGSFFHDRYISDNSSYQIDGISTDIVNLAQVTASAPQDDVIDNSGEGFLQGLYPPVGSIATDTLRNGSTIQSPLNGYQLIPMSDVRSGSGSEDNTWLQSTSSCSKAKFSSNNYLNSKSYHDLLSTTRGLYQSLEPLVNQTFNPSELSYKNAYTIWDLLYVALIHNSTASFPSSAALTDTVMQELLVLGNEHEFNLAYNISDPIRAVAGMTLAGEVLSALNETITSGGESKLNVQFGAYASFLSYFGLAGLSSANANFTGIPGYASSMAWELVTNDEGTGMPPTSDIRVRFMFHNGSDIGGSAKLLAYPLFGQSTIELPWSQFIDMTNEFAITSQQQWCDACGNSTGICASSSGAGDGSSSTSSAGSCSGRGMSLGVAGVIGALVTLGALVGLLILSMIIFGLRFVPKNAVAGIHRGSDASTALAIKTIAG
jgi:acid phosphatase